MLQFWSKTTSFLPIFGKNQLNTILQRRQKTAENKNSQNVRNVKFFNALKRLKNIKLHCFAVKKPRKNKNPVRQRRTK